MNYVAILWDVAQFWAADRQEMTRGGDKRAKFTRIVYWIMIHGGDNAKRSSPDHSRVTPVEEEEGLRNPLVRLRIKRPDDSFAYRF